MKFWGIQLPLRGNPFLGQLLVSVSSLVALLIAVGGNIILIALFWYYRQTKRGTKFEVSDYLMWFFVGNLVHSLVSFLVPILSLLTMWIPLIFLGWRINTLHDYKITQLFLEWIVVSATSFIVSLVVAIFLAFPMVLAAAISTLLGVAVTVIVQIVIAYITYYVLARYVLPWVHSQLGSTAPTKGGRMFAVTGIPS